MAEPRTRNARRERLVGLLLLGVAVVLLISSPTWFSRDESAVAIAQIVVALVLGGVVGASWSSAPRPRSRWINVVDPTATSRGNGRRVGGPSIKDVDPRASDRVRSARVGALAGELLLGDRADVHGVGAVDDAQGAGVRPELGQRGVVADPGATCTWMSRSMTSRHTFGADTLIAAISVRAPLAPYLSMRSAVLSTSSRAWSISKRDERDLLAHGALLGQRPAEGDPVLGALDHQAQCALGHADRPHAVVDAARAQAGLGDHEAVALAGQHVARGHPPSVNRSSEWPCWSWYPNTGRCRTISRPGVSRGAPGSSTAAGARGRRGRSCPSR